MWKIIAGRLLSFVPTIIVASMILFLAVNVVPGSAARAVLGIQATPQAIKRFEHKHGLDRPLYIQYADWSGKAIKGDLEPLSKIPSQWDLKLQNASLSRYFLQA